MTLERALQKAVEELGERNPRAMAARSGASYDEGQFRLPFFDRVFLIGFPDGVTRDERSGDVPAPWLHLMLLHYLASAKGYPLADRWVTFRHLPGANVFGVGFGEGPLDKLAALFGDDLEAFHRAARSLEGTFMNRMGDAAYRFLALPKITLACIIYQGDEEMAGSATILFDANAHLHLPTEDLAVLGGYLNDALRRRAGRNDASPYEHDLTL